jgi:hypothetical protein
MGGSLSDLSALNATYIVQILVYDSIKHQFSPDIQIQEFDGRVMKDIPFLLAKEKGVTPSDAWMEAYREWNNFQDGSKGCQGHPVFEGVDELKAFNQQGERLAQLLENEFREKNVKVAPYRPLYTNIEVGDVISAWWHLRDRNYGMVIPIQQLPVSEDLKSRLQAWRMLKNHNWLDPACCDSLNEQGHDLEERILWELNVEMEHAGIRFASPRRMKEKIAETASAESLTAIAEGKRTSEKVY